MIYWLFILCIAYGAIIGSFLNVVIYRLPEGLSLVRPGSRCPQCGNAIRWYDNVPVLSWLWLRAKCRYCGVKISFQYPLIEAISAGLFGLLFYLTYFTAIRPAYLDAPPAQTWPMLIVELVLVAALLAATVIDARYFIIPLPITTFATAVAVTVLTIGARYLPQLEAVAPSAGRLGVAVALGGGIGLGVANLLLQAGVLPRSFDEEEDEEAVDEPCEATPPALEPARPDVAVNMVQPELAESQTEDASESQDDDQPDFYHPHPRREVLKECLFLLFPVAGMAAGGWWLEHYFAPDGLVRQPWVRVLGGVMLGYLVGGGVVWAVRVLGTLGFGKEAMGLGDVHLMGTIGAVMGWFKATVAFFVAPFLGLVGALVMVGLARLVRDRFRMIPYGPYLAAAALLILFFERYWQPIFGMLTGSVRGL